MPDEPEPSEAELEERLKKLLGEAESVSDEELDEIELKLRSLEDKLESSGEERKKVDNFFDAEFEERLQKVHEKADRAKNRREGEASETLRRQGGDSISTRGLGYGLSIAYMILGLPMLGVGIGWIVDTTQHTTQGKGIGMIIGAVIGVAMAFVMMNRANDKQ